MSHENRAASWADGEFSPWAHRLRLGWHLLKYTFTALSVVVYYDNFSKPGPQGVAG